MDAPQTDYLVIGSGAVGLAFADTLLAQHPDAHITIVDRHGKPGGHWNDAYSFVSLHQPSAFYGVNGMALGTDRIDTHGANAGYYELASGAEVSGYFEQVMQRRLLPSGRLRYHPMCDYLGEGRFVSLLTGQQSHVHIRRKEVDGSYFGTSVPATHRPRFAVAEGVRLVPPNALPGLWQGAANGSAAPPGFVILGAGKTAMDVGVWLLGCGVAPERIQWVMPRDSWVVNRRGTQPGMAFLDDVLRGQITQFRALAECDSALAAFERMEQAGQMLRIDPSQPARMFHYATLSEGEVAQLRRITQVIRLGRVQSLTPSHMELAQGRIEVAPGTLFIDCTASAVTPRPSVDIFQPGRIVLQMVRVPLPTFSAALIAWVEAHGADDAARNALCAPIPLSDDIDSYPRGVMVGLQNQHRWSQELALRSWIRDSRLDGFAKLVAAVDKSDDARQALLLALKSAFQAAGAAAPRWMAGAPAPAKMPA